MKIIKLFFLFLTIICFVLSFDSEYMSIGKAWQIYHVNSLIGFQKVLESIFTFNAWYEIIIPILKLKLILVFSIFNLIIFIFLHIKK